MEVIIRWVVDYILTSCPVWRGTLPLSKEPGLNSEHVVRILKLADYDLPSLEGRYYNLKSEVKSLEAKKESLIRIIQDYDNQLTTLGKSFDSYCRLCQEEEVNLSNLQSVTL